MEWLRRYPGLVVLALVLAVRLLYLAEIEGSPLFRHPVVDAETYADQWLGAGVVLGLAALAVAPSLAIAAMALTWYCWRGRHTDRPHALRQAGALLLGVGLALACGAASPPQQLLYLWAHFAAVVVFFVTSCYRLPALPVLLLFAAKGGRWLWQHRQQRQGRWALAGLIPLALWSNWGLSPMQMAGEAAIHYNLGQAYAKGRQVDAARREFAEAVRLGPGYSHAWLNLGSRPAMSGDMREEAGIFERVAAAKPNRLEAWMDLARAPWPCRSRARPSRRTPRPLRSPHPTGGRSTWNWSASTCGPGKWPMPKRRRGEPSRSTLQKRGSWSRRSGR